MKKKTPLVFSLCFAALSATAVHAQTSGLYPINFDETQCITHASRNTSAIGLGSTDGSQSLEVNQGVRGLLYIKNLDNCFYAKAGDTVKPSFTSQTTWMAGYVYIDFDDNGLFDVDYDDSGVTNANELVTYSLYKNKDSNGNSVSGEPTLSPPSFVIPADTKPGIYRIRYKEDWDNVDPGGNNGSSNQITKNGGVIVDTRINIHAATSTLLLAEGVASGVLTLSDGSEAAGAAVLFRNAVRIVAHPAAEENLISIVVRHGYNLDGSQYVNGNKQWEETTVAVDATSPNECLLPAELIDGDVRLTPVFDQLDAVESGVHYGVNFEKDEANTSGNKVTSINFDNADEEGTQLLLDDDGNATVYQNHTDAVLDIEIGDVITPSVTLDRAEALTARLFIDFDQSGSFLSSMHTSGAVSTGSELVSYSCYNGKNSLGESVGAATVAMPSFSLPESITQGFYRARLVVDNDGINADGTEQTPANGGFIIDFLVNIHSSVVNVDINGINGTVVGASNSGVAQTAAYGESLSLMPLPAAEGYQVKSLTVRHGHNLNGEQMINGNRQWDEYEVEGAQANTDFEIVHYNVDGDILVTAVFEGDGTEEYSLVFADEFDGADGSLPDATVWHNSDRVDHVTWQRFTSQTAEGQARTAFLRDGKLVTRCIPNTIAEEGDGDMISGAIESSSKVYYQYGRIEGRLRTTPHIGNFPAFWLMPQDNSAGWPYAGEIDLWEQIDDENYTYHTVHTHVTYDLKKAKPNSGSWYADAAAWHVITAEWSPELITWYVDGMEAFSYAKSQDEDLLNEGQWPFDKPFYIILNQSVGNNSWAKDCDVNFEYETLFDYVRIYQKEGQTITKPIVSGINSAKTSETTLHAYATEGGVTLVAPQSQHAVIADLQGRTVYSRTVQGNTFVALPKGIYIVGGKKILVG